ncbi:MAG: hypothetical protein J6Z17_01520 [Treponema sp.]|nr:hypothetical protein [Treponema sp.]
MGWTKKKLLDTFLRNYTSRFTFSDVQNLCKSLGLELSREELFSFLEMNPLIFPLEKKTYITRAGAFTSEIFSIKPTACEVDKGVVVIGDRCIPFVDSEFLPHELSFWCEGHRLRSKTAEFDSRDAEKFYALYGEEYLSQYIAMEPENFDLGIPENDYLLPSKVNLACFDLEVLIKEYGFKKGDRLLCCVKNWDKGYINVMVVSEHSNDFSSSDSREDRIKWYSDLENALLESFKRHGPCSSIEEQLANVFLENRHLLCNMSCGSVEEYLARYAKKVSMEPFGVETRLWRRGENAPAVGVWNHSEMAQNFSEQGYDEVQQSFFSVPPFVFDQYVLDSLYRRDDNLDRIVELLFPDEDMLSDEDTRDLLLLLRQRRDILAKKYNWFADRGYGRIRQKALELYARVSFLVFQVDKSSSLDSFPQQELVILSQVYGHLLKMLQDIAEEALDESECESFLLSIEGMEWNFEDIQENILAAVERSRLNRFKVIKS